MPWTDIDVQALRAYHPHMTNLELAKALGGRHSVADVASKANRLGLKKTAEQLRRSAQSGYRRFPRRSI